MADNRSRCAGIVKLVKLIASAFMLAGAAACATTAVRPASEFPYEDDLSLLGFAEEALHGHGTPRTHRFDDYTKGSYHVNPDEVVEGLFRSAPRYKLQLTAVIVVGSYGPLWAYDVITIVSEENCTRVNWLTMPHARITLKRTGCVPPDSMSVFLAEMRSLATLPARPASGESCLVLKDRTEPRWSKFGCYDSAASEDVARVERALNVLGPTLTRTYSTVAGR